MTKLQLRRPDQDFYSKFCVTPELPPESGLVRKTLKLGYSQSKTNFS